MPQPLKGEHKLWQLPKAVLKVGRAEAVQPALLAGLCGNKEVAAIGINTY